MTVIKETLNIYIVLISSIFPGLNFSLNILSRANRHTEDCSFWKTGNPRMLGTIFVKQNVLSQVRSVYVAQILKVQQDSHGSYLCIEIVEIVGNAQSWGFFNTKAQKWRGLWPVFLEPVSRMCIFLYNLCVCMYIFNMCFSIRRVYGGSWRKMECYFPKREGRGGGNCFFF